MYAIYERQHVFSFKIRSLDVGLWFFFFYIRNSPGECVCVSTVCCCCCCCCLFSSFLLSSRQPVVMVGSKQMKKHQITKRNNETNRKKYIYCLCYEETLISCWRTKRCYHWSERIEHTHGNGVIVWVLAHAMDIVVWVRWIRFVRLFFCSFFHLILNEKGSRFDIRLGLGFMIETWINVGRCRCCCCCCWFTISDVTKTSGANSHTFLLLRYVYLCDSIGTRLAAPYYTLDNLA